MKNREESRSIKMMRRIRSMKGYFVDGGYMGYVDGSYMLFAGEEDYFEYMEEM